MRRGSSVLNFAPKAGALKILKPLIENTAKDNHGRTMLHYVASAGAWEVVWWLIEKNADVHAKDECGMQRKRP